MTTTIYTRIQYLAKECTHDEYYSQFLTEAAIRLVADVIGAKRIQQSTDPHFNDIPLDEWDRLNMSSFINHDDWREANGHENRRTYPWSMSDNVCIAKAAARRIQQAKGANDANDEA